MALKDGFWSFRVLENNSHINLHLLKKILDQYFERKYKKAVDASRAILFFPVGLRPNLNPETKLHPFVRKSCFYKKLLVLPY